MKRPVALLPVSAKPIALRRAGGRQTGASQPRASHAGLRLAAIVLAVLLLAGCGSREQGPFHGIDLRGESWGRGLTLPDLEGRPRSLADFQGRYALLTFGYTHCPEVCPLSLLKTAQVRRGLGVDAQHLQLLFVTVDPERDTPQVMARYVAAFDPGIVALRGDLEQTRRAANSFRATFRKVPNANGYAMDHTMLIYLIGPDQQLRLAFRHDETPERMLADLRKLMVLDAAGAAPLP